MTAPNVMPTPALACRELVELVTDYIEDTLPPADRDRFEAHIAACPACALYVAQMRDAIRLTGSLSKDSLSPAALETLLQAFRDWKAGR